MDSVHHIWCPLSSQEYQDLPDGAETTLTVTYCGEMKHNHCFCMCLLRLLRLFLTTDFVHIIKKIKKLMPCGGYVTNHGERVRTTPKL
ncbi:hypothetical protein DV715_26340 [Klebsiella pneumoniae]|nr:hypothetical protein [Klebsiella pneumoniae]